MPRTRRRLVAVLVIPALLAMVAATMLAGPAQAATAQPITNWANRKCIDAAVERERLGQVQIWDCNGQPQQQWTERITISSDGTRYITEFVNQKFGMCLNDYQGTIGIQACNDDLGGSTQNQWVVYYAYNPGAAVGGWYQQLQNIGDGSCLTLNDNSSLNGTGLHIYPCDPTHNSTAQRWKLGGN